MFFDQMKIFNSSYKIIYMLCMPESFYKKKLYNFNKIMDFKCLISFKLNKLR